MKALAYILFVPIAFASVGFILYFLAAALFTFVLPALFALVSII